MKKKKSAKYRSKPKNFSGTPKTTKNKVKTYSPQTQSKHIKTPTNIFNNSDAKEIENTGMRLNKYIAQYCDQPVEKIEEDTDRDFFMTPYEALDYGIIDEVIKTKTSHIPLPAMPSLKF